MKRRATSDESESLGTTNMISCDFVSSEDKADIKDIKPLVEYVEPNFEHTLLCSVEYSESKVIKKELYHGNLEKFKVKEEKKAQQRTNKNNPHALKKGSFLV